MNTRAASLVGLFAIAFAAPAASGQEDSPSPAPSAVAATSTYACAVFGGDAGPACDNYPIGLPAPGSRRTARSLCM